MSVYWDTSALLTLSPEVYAKLREPARHFTLSHITELEISSALARPSGRRRHGLDRVRRLVVALHRRLEQFSLRARLDAVFADGRALSTKHGLGANDSLHLAAALQVCAKVQDPMEFASYDRDLRRAAFAEGLALFPM